MGALTACHLLKLKRKKVKFAPGETPAFVFCAKNFPETFENFFLFIFVKRKNEGKYCSLCSLLIINLDIRELIMKLNRSKNEFKMA